MDGDPVKGEPSEPFELGELLVKLCPQYMAMGMSYEQYWHSNTMCHRAYRETREILLKQEEWARWRQGAYYYEALLLVSPVMRAALSNARVEPGKYPDEPWPLTEKEAQEREEAREKEKYERYLAKMNADSERELKRRAQMAKEAKENGQCN